MREDHLLLRTFRQLLPSPFSIALVLTLLVYLLAFFFTSRPENAVSAYPIKLLMYWQTGFWELLSFTMQMSLILILGHALALTVPFNQLITFLTKYCRHTASAAWLVSLITIALSFVNWGLCLVFGAIFARKIGEQAQKEGISINYPLVGAAGYSGMMCWHGGLSGSAPLTVSGYEHFLVERIGSIGIEQTLFSPMNLTAAAALLIIIPAFFYGLGKKGTDKPITIDFPQPSVLPEEKVTGAERLDHAKWLAITLGLLICFLSVRQIIVTPKAGGLNFIDLNFINFFLFGLGILMHGSLARFLVAIQEAIGGAAGIIIQFPLYAGIMGIMNYSGLGAKISLAIVALANAETLPIFTFFSAALVNIFVPSGGGQWVVQGPIIADAAYALGVSLPKNIMALAYGDQLTNMLQPFWALPLLGITRLKARDILPYSGLVMLVGMIIFILLLTIF